MEHHQWFVIATELKAGLHKHFAGVSRWLMFGPRFSTPATLPPDDSVGFLVFEYRRLTKGRRIDVP